MKAAVGDAKSILTAVLTMGVANLAGFPELLTAALASVPAAAAALRAEIARAAAEHEIEGQHLFFLYRTEKLLS